MNIDDINKLKFNGLHIAIENAGYRLWQADGVWLSTDDTAVENIIASFTVEQAILEVSANIEAIAANIRTKATENISPAEMSSWSIKRSEALAYIETQSLTDAPSLSAEANVRGVTIDDLVQKVMSNSSRLISLETYISGMSGKHRDAVASMTTFADIASYDYSAGWND